MYKVKRFIKKIIKVCKYLPVLWRDEDWDYEFMLDLLKYKLVNMKECIYREGSLGVQDLHTVCATINETLDHIYNFKNADEVYEKQKNPLPFETSFLTYPVDNGCHRLLTINKETGLPLTEEEDQQYTDNIMASYEFEQKEWEAIWDTIKEHGRKWWD